MESKKKYTPAERQAWHNEMSKKGATKFDTKTGEKVFVSDFERGCHHAKATEILNARRRTKLWHEKQGK